MVKIAIVIGNALPGRKVEIVARWIYDNALKYAALLEAGAVEFESVDC